MLVFGLTHIKFGSLAWHIPPHADGHYAFLPFSQMRHRSHVMGHFANDPTQEVMEFHRAMGMLHRYSWWNMSLQV